MADGFCKIDYLIVRSPSCTESRRAEDTKGRISVLMHRVVKSSSLIPFRYSRSKLVSYDCMFSVRLTVTAWRAFCLYYTERNKQRKQTEVKS